MQINDPQLRSQANEFSLKNSIAGMFTMSAIIAAALLRSKRSNYQDPVMVWQKVCVLEKRVLKSIMNDAIEEDPELATSSNTAVTRRNHAKISDYFQSRLSGKLPAYKKGLKVKHLVLNTLLQNQLYNVHESLPPLQVIEMVLKEFRPQIAELSKTIKYKPSKTAEH